MMNVSMLTQMEERISQLSRDEQLWLIERLAHRLRENIAHTEGIRASQIAAMAADPQIQNELREIEKEFAATESDGLERISLASIAPSSSQL